MILPPKACVFSKLDNNKLHFFLLELKIVEESLNGEEPIENIIRMLSLFELENVNFDIGVSLEIATSLRSVCRIRIITQSKVGGAMKRINIRIFTFRT